MRKKSRVRYWIQLLLFCFGFGAAVFTAGYFYLDSKLNMTVSEGKSDVPYYEQVPENVGLRFDFCEDSIFLYLDFENENTTVLFGTGEDFDDYILHSGFCLDSTVSGDYSDLGVLIDAVGGIDLTIGGETLRYTGVQISDMLVYSFVEDSLKRDISQKVISAVCERGISEPDIITFLEGCETELKFADVYGWGENLSGTLRFVRFVN